MNFDKPTVTDKRKHLQKQRAKKGRRMYEPRQVRQLLNATKGKPEMRAMVLLGINCGLGNTDVAELSQSVIDLKKGTM